LSGGGGRALDVRVTRRGRVFLRGMKYTPRRVCLLRTISSQTEGRLLRGAGKSGPGRPAVFMAELRRTDSLLAVDWKSRAAKALDQVLALRTFGAPGPGGRRG